MNKYMEIAKNESIGGIEKGDGGPFGAVIVDKDGNVVSCAHNKVLLSHDPTAHAEVEAIRTACSILKTHDLSRLYFIYFMRAMPYVLIS